MPPVLIQIRRMRHRRPKDTLRPGAFMSICGSALGIFFLLTSVLAWRILLNTIPPITEEMPMSDSCERQSKQEVLRRNSCLNHRPHAVKDELFGSDEFFDCRDMPQVKYEMLRRVVHDKKSVSASAGDFGFSRVAFYQARDAFEKEGLCGLLPRKRGPKDRHKLTAEVMRFVNEAREGNESVGPVLLAQRIEERFGIRVHPRSIQRAVAAQKKKLSGRRDPAE